MNRKKNELRDNLAHESNWRRDLSDNMKDSFNELTHNLSQDRAAYAIAQLENERTIRSLRDERTADRQDIALLHKQFALLDDQTGSLKRDQSKVVSILERGGLIRASKRPLTDNTSGDD